MHMVMKVNAHLMNRIKIKFQSESVWNLCIDVFLLRNIIKHGSVWDLSSFLSISTRGRRARVVEMRSRAASFSNTWISCATTDTTATDAAATRFLTDIAIITIVGNDKFTARATIAQTTATTTTSTIVRTRETTATATNIATTAAPANAPIIPITSGNDTNAIIIGIESATAIIFILMVSSVNVIITSAAARRDPWNAATTTVVW